MTPDPSVSPSPSAGRSTRSGQGATRSSSQGSIGLVAEPEQLATIGKIQALMSLLEGHGDITMNRAGAELVPEAPWFASVLRERRKRAGPGARLMQQLIGWTRSCASTSRGSSSSRRWRKTAGRRCWRRSGRHPDRLPTLDEIRDPAAWIARMNSLRARRGVSPDDGMRVPKRRSSPALHLPPAASPAGRAPSPAVPDSLALLVLAVSAGAR